MDKPQQLSTTIPRVLEARPHLFNVSRHNEELAIRNRITLKTNPYQKGLEDNTFELQPTALTKADRWDLARHMDSTKSGKRYQAAAASLSNTKLSSKDYPVSMFQKVEKMWKEPKDPRCIQFRNPRFTLELARYTRPIEERFTAKLNTFRTDIHIHTTKGLNINQSAKLLWDFWNHTGATVAYCLDFKRCDAHVKVEHLKAKAKWYCQHFKGDRYLAHLLSRQLNTKGRGAMGHKYSKRGGLCSGESDTSLGTTWICMKVFETVRRLMGNPDIHLVGMGDDGVVFGRTEAVRALVDIYPRVSAQLGMSVEGSLAYHFEEIEYCSCHPMLVNNTPTMVREFPKPLITDGWATDKDPNVVSHKLRSAAISAAYTYEGQPIYQAWALHMLNNTKSVVTRNKTKAVHANTTTKLDVQMAILQAPISDLTRVNFWAAYGITPQEQIELENSMDTRAVKVGKNDLKILGLMVQEF